MNTRVFLNEYWKFDTSELSEPHNWQGLMIYFVNKDINYCDSYKEVPEIP